MNSTWGITYLFFSSLLCVSLVPALEGKTDFLKILPSITNWHRDRFLPERQASTWTYPPGLRRLSRGSHSEIALLLSVWTEGEWTRMHKERPNTLSSENCRDRRKNFNTGLHTNRIFAHGYSTVPRAIAESSLDDPREEDSTNLAASSNVSKLITRIKETRKFLARICSSAMRIPSHSPSLNPCALFTNNNTDGTKALKVLERRIYLDDWQLGQFDPIRNQGLKTTWPQLRSMWLSLDLTCTQTHP